MTLHEKVTRCRLILIQAVGMNDVLLMKFMFHIIIKPMLLGFSVGFFLGVAVCGLVIFSR